MFGHISRRSSIFTSQCESLDQTQDEDEDRSGITNSGIAGNESDRKCGGSHKDQGKQKCIFPSDKVTKSSEDQCSKWPYNETSSKNRESIDKGRGSGICRK